MLVHIILIKKQRVSSFKILAIKRGVVELRVRNEFVIEQCRINLLFVV